MLVSFVLALVAALPDALLALWLMLLGEGVHRQSAALITTRPSGWVSRPTATWFLRTISTRVQRRFRDKVTIALESHVARLQASRGHDRASGAAGISRSPVGAAQSGLRARSHVHVGIHDLQLDLTAGRHDRLIDVGSSGVDSAGVVLAADGHDVDVAPWHRTSRAGARRTGRTPRQASLHHGDHGPSGKEVRVTGIATRLVAERRAAWERWSGPVASARWSSAAWHTLAWAIFGFAYVGAVVFVSSGLRAPAGQSFCWCWPPDRGCRRTSARPLARSVSCAASGWTVRGGWHGWRTTRRRWRRQPISRLPRGCSRASASIACRLPIQAPRVVVLEDVSLMLPAGAVVAIVGENGAGKTTLVKLLAKMYEPTSGTIFVDDTPLSRIAAEDGDRAAPVRFRIFSDSNFVARQTVGIGDLPRLDDRPAVVDAVDRAGAEDVVARLKNGLDTQLGPTWPGGVDVSFGQWQKLALARGFMRDEPLLLILDEPTAALDAETEHALFERYAAASQRPPIRAADRSRC